MDDTSSIPIHAIKIGSFYLVKELNPNLIILSLKWPVGVELIGVISLFGNVAPSQA